MAKEPGNQALFGAVAKQEWDNKISGMFSDEIGLSGTRHFVAIADESVSVDVVDWDANPIRVQTCLKSRSKTMRLADWVNGTGDMGRLTCHEEYMEWRTVRNAAGKIVRVEMTTETLEYWETLARHEPVKLLSTIARFAGEPSVPVQAVYGPVNPNAPGTTPAQRGNGFRSMMLPRNGRPPLSPYNNGLKAICFMYSSINTLGAAAKLVACAGFPFGKVVGGETQPMTGAEVIASRVDTACDGSAVDCRNSDPTIVGGVVGQSFAGKKIAFDDPFGVYITQIAHDRLLLPDQQTAVPLEWFNLQRGTPSADGRSRSQRAVFEVPADLDFEVGDLIDSQTGETIAHGYQVAQLVKVGFYYRAFGNVAGSPKVIALRPTAKCADDPGCGFFRTQFARFEQEQPVVDEAAGLESIESFSRRRDDIV